MGQAYEAPIENANHACRSGDEHVGQTRDRGVSKHQDAATAEDQRFRLEVGLVVRSCPDKFRRDVLATSIGFDGHQEPH